MMKIIFPLSITLIFASCFPSPVHVDKAESHMISFSAKMEREGFQLTGSGGAMMDDIKGINLSYQTSQNLNVDEVRILLVQRIEAFLYQINKDCEIRPYLHDYPFSSRNVYFTITFSKKNGDYVDPPFVAYVALMNKRNIIAYYTFDKEKDALEDFHIESYDDALKIYNETLQAGLPTM